ncbi:MAG: MBL fold metallo-hydrolase [Candidatus Bipolaricaulota bacterium]
MKLLSYSKALYSSWLYYSPDRLLFDAGESVSSIMGNKTFAIEKIFLSHGHTDHIAGLVSMINIRNNAMGDKLKPLSIYYPRNNFHISELMNYMYRTNSNISYSLDWIPLQGGDEVHLFGEEGSRSARSINAFATEHSRGETSLGYNIVEQRERLKPEFRDKSQEEIRDIARSRGRGAITEDYRQRLFSYGGDSVPLNPEDVSSTEVLCHDTTFLKEEDRKQYKHATLREALQVGIEAGVKKKMICMHISTRYKKNYKEIAEEVISEEDPRFDVKIIPPGRIYREY